MLFGWIVRLDTWLTLDFGNKFHAVAHRYRFLLAFLVVALSVADLLLTQTILTMVEGKTAQPGEANALMAPIVMSWWAWPVRVGIPVIVATRDLRRHNYNLMTCGVVLYAAVVAWNTHMLQIVRSA